MKLTHFGMSVDLYHIIFYYHAVLNTFIQKQATISDTYVTYTPPCFPFFHSFISPSPMEPPSASNALSCYLRERAKAWNIVKKKIK